MITISATHHPQLIRPYLILSARFEKYMRISSSVDGAGKEEHTSATFLGTQLQLFGPNHVAVIYVAKPDHRASADPLEPLALRLGEGVDIVIEHIVVFIAVGRKRIRMLITTGTPHLVNDPVVMELMGSRKEHRRKILPLEVETRVAAGVKAVVPVKQRQLKG